MRTLGGHLTFKLVWVSARWDKLDKIDTEMRDRSDFKKGQRAPYVI